MGEISPAAYFIGSVLFVILSSFLNQKQTNRKINARNDTLDGLKETIDKQATQISNQNGQIASLKEDLKEVRAERDKANEAAGKLQTQIDRLGSDIKDLQAVNTQAATDMVRLTQERDEAVTKYRSVQEQYTKVLEDSISMGKALAKLQDEMDEMKVALASYKRVDEIISGVNESIGKAVREGFQQALATSEILRVKVGENPA